MLSNHISVNRERVKEKLGVLADAAKYDVSCSSSGSNRSNKTKGIGNTTVSGICHSYTEDGRCVSLLKILLTNYCIFDCLYCVSRKSNDVKRAGFTVQEVVDLTLHFYRRNYIEGLFLSSGIFKNADYTMERLVRVARILRTEHKFNGYIHIKTIPGCSDDLMKAAAEYADRVSVNIEMPTETSLKQFAPEKNHSDIIRPMGFLSQGILASADERKVIRSAPAFAPAGQSTQMVVGASAENDYDIMQVANKLYEKYSLKRVYYSGYVPISLDNRLPQLGTPVPLIRENRLYQADWLLRYYQFSVDEVIEKSQPHLDLDIDPKLAWALRNLDKFPVDINRADYHMILRVPGIGVSSAIKIVKARKFRKLNWEELKRFGIALNRARYFILCERQPELPRELQPFTLREKILAASNPVAKPPTQLGLFV